MLISRKDLTFPHGGAKFNTREAADREVLGWIMNQFLYGEVTGIQCGHWLYRAPSINAASFLARQAAEEFSHVKRFLRVLSLLGQKAEPPHRGIKFLATGMMGASWGEHVCLEMALGEGLVLTLFYLLAETIDDPEIVKILESSILEEERHVEFGERETAEWLKAHPEDRSFLAAQCLVQVIAMKSLRRFVIKRWLDQKKGGQAHPVLSQFPVFFDFLIERYEERLQKLGVSERALSGLSLAKKAGLLLALPWRKLSREFKRKLFRRERLLTETYLNDPVVRLEMQKPRVGDTPGF